MRELSRLVRHNLQDQILSKTGLTMKRDYSRKTKMERKVKTRRRAKKGKVSQVLSRRQILWSIEADG